MATEDERTIQKRIERFNTFLESDLYSKVNRVCMAVGYGFAFQRGDDRPVKKILDTFINGGFIKAQLKQIQSEKKRYETWLKQMGQYIYDSCSTSEYEFDELVVLHEIANVRRLCVKE